MSRDSEQGDLLTHGEDRPTLLGRGRDRLVAGPAGEFVRRHPRRVAIAGCLIAVLAGLTGHAITRAPAVAAVVRFRADPEVTVHFLGRAPVGDDAWLHLVDPHEDIEGSYHLSTGGVGHEVGVIGIVGPGLARETGDGTGAAGTGSHLRAGATLDCSAGDWWAATVRDYRLRVSRTGAQARVTEYDAPLGPGSTDLRAMVQQACLRRAVTELPADSWTVEATPGTRQTQISVRLRNPNPYPLWLRAASWWGPSPSDATSTIVLAAGQTARLTMTPLILDCTSPEAFPFFFVDRRGSTYLTLRVGAGALRPGPTDADDPQLAGLPIEQQQVDSINRGLARACRGAPTAASSITRVQPVTASGSALRWRIDVLIRADADRVEFGASSLTPGSYDDPMLEGYDDPHLTLPGPATIHGGVARAA